MSSGKWRDPGVPHRGWVHLGCEDSGELSIVCEMCEKEWIRHIHSVSHPNYPDELRVGCVCAEHLTQDYQGPRRAERAVKAQRKRLRTFVEKGWQQGLDGSQWRHSRGRYVVVAPRGGAWIARVDGKGGRRDFVDRDAAAIAIFKYLNPPSETP